MAGADASRRSSSSSALTSSAGVSSFSVALSLLSVLTDPLSGWIGGKEQTAAPVIRIGGTMLALEQIRDRGDRIALRSVACGLARPGDDPARRPGDYRVMLPGHSLPTAARRLAAPDAAWLAAACGHVLIPSQPAAAGYRYIDLGADTAPFYVRRFGLGERTAAVCLRAPVECSSGGDAERGAAALAACEVTVGVRRIPWADLL